MLMPAWAASSKTSVRMRMERTHSDFRGLGPLTGAPRSDTAYLALLGVDWKPLRNLTLDAGIQRQWRNSNTAGLNYETHIAAVNAKLSF